MLYPELTKEVNKFIDVFYARTGKAPCMHIISEALGISHNTIRGMRRRGELSRNFKRYEVAYPPRRLHI
jgi:hypothetical protein